MSAAWPRSAWPRSASKSASREAHFVAAVAAAARAQQDLQRRRDAEGGHLAVEPAQVALHAVHDAEQVARAQPHLPGEDRLALGVLAQRLRRNRPAGLGKRALEVRRADARGLRPAAAPRGGPAAPARGRLGPPQPAAERLAPQPEPRRRRRVAAHHKGAAQAVAAEVFVGAEQRPADAGARRLPAREQAGARRRAHRGAGVKFAAHNAAGGERVRARQRRHQNRHARPLGHFFAARARGIHVNQFAVGFGPNLFTYRGPEVEYSLKAIPLGGYVAFPDDDEVCPYPEDDPDLLRNRPTGDRALVVSAGIIANVIFAFGILYNQVTTIGFAEQTYEP